MGNWLVKISMGMPSNMEKSLCLMPATSVKSVCVTRDFLRCVDQCRVPHHPVLTGNKSKPSAASLYVWTLLRHRLQKRPIPTVLTLQVSSRLRKWSYLPNITEMTKRKLCHSDKNHFFIWKNWTSAVKRLVFCHQIQCTIHDYITSL